MIADYTNQDLSLDAGNGACWSSDVNAIHVPCGFATSGASGLDAKNERYLDSKANATDSSTWLSSHASVEDLDVAATDLKVATNTLQAALANWEECIQSEEEHLRQNARAQYNFNSFEKSQLSQPMSGGTFLGQDLLKEAIACLGQANATLKDPVSNINADSTAMQGRTQDLETMLGVTMQSLSVLLQAQTEQAEVVNAASAVGMSPFLPALPPGWDSQALPGQMTEMPYHQHPDNYWWGAAARPGPKSPLNAGTPGGKGNRSGPKPATIINGVRPRGVGKMGEGDNPQAVPQQTPHNGETLRSHLRSLIDVDSNRVLIARKINRLGFGSPAALEEHFSWYGKVEKVLVAHSLVKSDSGSMPRLRPSGLGFIVMAKNEEAQAILDVGTEQMVRGCVVRVQPFERRMTEAAAAGDGEECDDAATPTADAGS